MNLCFRTLAVTILAVTASPALAQNNTMPPEPLPQGIAYFYQPGNPTWYQPVVYYPNPYYTYSSPYPFGSTSWVYGRYSWDYGVSYPATVQWHQPTIAVYSVATPPTVTWYSAYYPYYYPYVYQYTAPGYRGW